MTDRDEAAVLDALGIHVSNPNTRRAITQALAAAREAEREACCKAVCWHCKGGKSVEPVVESGWTWWYHSDPGWFGHRIRCDAQGIRALPLSEKPAKEER